MRIVGGDVEKAELLSYFACNFLLVAESLR